MTHLHSLNKMEKICDFKKIHTHMKEIEACAANDNLFLCFKNLLFMWMEHEHLSYTIQTFSVQLLEQ